MDVYWKVVIFAVVVVAVGLIVRLVRQDMADAREAEAQLKADNEEAVREAEAALAARRPYPGTSSARAAPAKPAPSSSTTRVSNHLRADRDDDDDAWRRNSAALHQSTFVPSYDPTPSHRDSWTCSGASSMTDSSSSSCSSDSGSSCSASCD